MACLQIYRELSLATFLRVHSNWKEASYLSWQNTYPNLNTNCHNKVKFFLWTKLPENLLLAKYLISVTANLKLLIACFYSFSLWMFYIFLYKWNCYNSKAQKFSRGLFFLLRVIQYSNFYDAISVLTNCFKYVICKQWLCNVKKFIKFTLNLAQNRQKTQKEQSNDLTE